MKKFLLAFAFAFSTSAASGCGAPGGVPGRACTLIGCDNQVSIIVRRADGQPPRLASEIVVDGRTIVCAAPADYEPWASCGTQATISQREVMDCHDTRTPPADSSAVVSSPPCVGIGQFEQTISVRGMPKRVDVSLKEGADVIAQRTFEPNYRPVFPNGVACGAACEQASELWTLQ